MTMAAVRYIPWGHLLCRIPWTIRISCAVGAINQLNAPERQVGPRYASLPASQVKEAA